MFKGKRSAAGAITDSARAEDDGGGWTTYGGGGGDRSLVEPDGLTLTICGVNKIGLP